MNILKIVKLLVPKVKNFNAPMTDGWTPIHLAVLGGHVETLKMLMTTTDNHNALAPTGRTAVQLAADNNHSEVMFILLTAMLDKPKTLDIVNVLK